MMMETLGLVETLEWHIADKMFLGIENFERAGSGSDVATDDKVNKLGEKYPLLCGQLFCSHLIVYSKPARVIRSVNEKLTKLYAGNGKIIS